MFTSPEVLVLRKLLFGLDEECVNRNFESADDSFFLSEQYPIVSFATIHVARFGDAECVFHSYQDGAVGQMF